MKKLCHIFIFLIFLSCKQHKKECNSVADYHSHKDSVDTLISSISIDTLGQIIDLKEFKPLKVDFRYFPITICGLEDKEPPLWRLEAVLFFDNNTIKKLNKFLDKKNDTTSAYLNPYFFEWLNANEVTVLSKSKTQLSKIILQRHNEPFSKSNCDYILISNAVFLKHESYN